MEAIETIRRATQQANRDTAIHKQDATIQSAQNKSRDYESDLFALPVDKSNYRPIQDLNPASPTYGLFYEWTDYGDTSGGSGTTPRP